MEKTTRIMFGAAVCVAVLIATTQPVVAGIVNGDFSSGGYGWTTSGSVSFEGWFAESAGLVQGDDDPPSDSILSQRVTLGEDDNWLSFYLKMETGPCGETDYFYATFDEKEVCTWSSSEFTGGTREAIITYDVSNWAPNQYNLVFKLVHDPCDYCTEVTIDDVILTSNPPMIPVPGALLLGGLGSALVVLMKRSRMLGIVG